MSEMQGGHQIELLQGTAQWAPAMRQAIDAARTQVLLETYIFDLTGVGSTLADTLADAAQRGVQVQLMMDGVGTPALPLPWVQRFAAAGVQWHRYAPLGRLGLLIPSRWRRLHRKLCVVDGRVAFCGGINVLDDLHDPNHGALTHPRLDFAVQVQGPLVREVQQAMLSLWWRTRAARAARERNFSAALQSLQQAPFWPPRASPALGPPAEASPQRMHSTSLVVAQVIFRDNLRHRREIEQAYLKAIGQAKREVLIANAYFLPGRRLRRALTLAAQRGVRVQLLLQGRYEYFMQYHASRPVYGALLAHGVHIHEYARSFMHAKVAVVDAGTDAAWATVGSSNLDPLSLLLAREANVVVRDSAFASNLRSQLVQAMQAHGHAIDAQYYARRSRWVRMVDWLAYGLMRFALFVTGKRY